MRGGVGDKRSGDGKRFGHVGRGPGLRRGGLRRGGGAAEDQHVLEGGCLAGQPGTFLARKGIGAQVFPAVAAKIIHQPCQGKGKPVCRGFRIPRLFAPARRRNHMIFVPLHLRPLADLTHRLAGFAGQGQGKKGVPGRRGFCATGAMGGAGGCKRRKA